jgi:alpha-D-ribose 1-methylphosphonate 5-phosphate C-P lyase
MIQLEARLEAKFDIKLKKAIAKLQVGSGSTSSIYATPPTRIRKIDFDDDEDV